jgi:hypothetical protein
MNEKHKARKLSPAFERFAKFAKAVFGVPKTEVEAEDAKWRSERAERRVARKKSGAA